MVALSECRVCQSVPAVLVIQSTRCLQRNLNTHTMIHTIHTMIHTEGGHVEVMSQAREDGSNHMYSSTNVKPHPFTCRIIKAADHLSSHTPPSLSPSPPLPFSFPPSLPSSLPPLLPPSLPNSHQHCHTPGPGQTWSSHP